MWWGGKQHRCINTHTDTCLNKCVSMYVMYIETKRGHMQTRDHNATYCTCLAFDLLIVSEMGFFFSLTALLENRSTNSSKSTVGSSIFSHTSEAAGLKTEREGLYTV